MRQDRDGVYGLGGHGTLTPHGGFAFTDGNARDYRLGARPEVAPAFEPSLEGTRRESATAEPEHGLRLRGPLRW